jgi:hypothetical protein
MLVALAGAALLGAAPAEAWVRPVSSVPVINLLTPADWQDPEMLPPRFRNHCAYDVYRRRFFCSNHCGLDYQFYYCSPASFGCCHIGFGYCDWSGLLRCHP